VASGLLPEAPVHRAVRAGWWSWLAVAVAVAVGVASAGDPVPDAGTGRADQGSPLRIERVEVLGQPHPAVRLVLSAPATPSAHALPPVRAGAPERVYLDVPGAAFDSRVRRVIPGAGPIRRVRTAPQAGGTARVVIETARRLPFTLASAGDGVTVVFATPPDTPAKPDVPAAVERAAPVAAVVPAAPPEPAATPATTPALASIDGTLFLWPALDDPAYAETAASPLRQALEAWRQGGRPQRPLPAPASPAERYLAADLAYLRAASGDGDLLAARQAYEQALRAAPDFPDAPRGALMLGLTNLALGFGPEAGAAFRRLVERHPESPLVPLARVGGAAALRLMHRPEQALRAIEAVLPAATGGVLCEARVEQAADASALGRATEAADALRSAVALCPELLARRGLLRAYAQVLADGGARTEARRLLAGPHPALGVEEEARLGLLAGTLALADGDEAEARARWRAVASGGATPPAERAEAETRLAELDATRDPAAAAAALTRLAEATAAVPVRLEALLAAARASAAAGRADEALALIDRASHLGPDGAAKAAAARSALVSRWLHDADARGDAAGVVSLYATYATTIEAQASAEDRLVIARALAALGLHASARRVLEGIHDRTPEVTAALAEEALAAGDLAAAGAAAASIGSDADPAIVARARRVAVRVALAAGDADVAAAALPPDDPLLRAEVAEALLARPEGAARARAVLAPALADGAAPPAVLLAAGDAAAAAGDWAAAADAYGRALDAETTGPMRVRAAAGLARTALARGDGGGAAAALARIGSLDDAVVGRAVTAVARALAHEGAWRQADAR
jgi:tetratricopeptide (TPR) repeat protein